jgi:hypothetical protein
MRPQPIACSPTHHHFDEIGPLKKAPRGATPVVRHSMYCSAPLIKRGLGQTDGNRQTCNSGCYAPVLHGPQGLPTMRILLIIPPMTDLNTPYPSTAYLAGYLQPRGYDVIQWDASLDLFLRLHSRSGIAAIREVLTDQVARGSPSKAIDWFIKYPHEDLVEPVVRFLQGKDPTLAHRIVSGLLPKGITTPRISESKEDAFGSFGIADHAKYLGSLYLRNISHSITSGVDRRWLAGNRYSLTHNQPQSHSFDRYEEALIGRPTMIVELMLDMLRDTLVATRPDVVGITVPFEGQLLASLYFGRAIKDNFPDIRVVVGGGLINTTMRSLSDARVFKYTDYVTVDDGERPLECVLQTLEGTRPSDALLRTFVCCNGAVKLLSSTSECDVSAQDMAAPSYRGLRVSDYISQLRVPNRMERLWSDGMWNKLTLAHGCYWGKCTFCDVTLDYVHRYEPTQADTIVERMRRLAADTGQTGFHFVDEAAPPALLRSLSRRILEAGFVCSWWTNIRFEKAFDKELTQLMANAGCIAVSGGLEVASDRLLKLINKGVTVRQVARTTRAFVESGIRVHAYLMYGFPSQNEQELVDSAEIVRQLFENGCIDSAYWHEFVATAHSPVGLRPDLFGIKLQDSVVSQPIALQRYDVKTQTLNCVPTATSALDSNTASPRQDVFMRYSLAIQDDNGCDLRKFSHGLRASLHNYVHGLEVQRPVHLWFPRGTCKPSVKRNLIATYLQDGPAVIGESDDVAHTMERKPWRSLVSLRLPGRR